MKRILCLTLLALSIAEAPAAAATTSLREALTFQASFDHGPDADFGKSDRRLFSAPSMKHPRTGTPGLPTNGVVSITMLGISYTGLFDELAFFNRSLTAAEVEQLFALPGGVTTLHQ